MTTHIHLAIQDNGKYLEAHRAKQIEQAVTMVKEAITDGAIPLDEIQGLATTCVSMLNNKAIPSMEHIRDIVCQELQVKPELVHTKTRKRYVVKARQTTMYFIKNLTKHSLKTIGAFFGGFDHTTVIHSYDTVTDLLETDSEYVKEVEMIKLKLFV